MPSCSFCTSWMARASRLIAGVSSVPGRVCSSSARGFAFTPAPRVQRSLALRKTLGLSLADRPRLGCTSRNQSSPTVSAHAFISLQGITHTSITSRLKTSTSPAVRRGGGAVCFWTAQVMLLAFGIQLFSIRYCFYLLFQPRLGGLLRWWSENQDVLQILQQLVV